MRLAASLTVVLFLMGGWISSPWAAEPTLSSPEATEVGGDAGSASDTTATPADAPRVRPEPAGRVVAIQGSASAVDRQGKSRALTQGAEVFEGDTLLTGEGTQIQLRFTDGGLLSLRAKSEFRIDQYRYEEQPGALQRAFFSLLKGGLRTITGLIGHRHREDYKVETPVATIGKRGTHYALYLCAAGACLETDGVADGLYGGVLEGAIAATTNAGVKVFSTDQYFHVPGRDALPGLLLQPPGMLFMADSAGDQAQGRRASPGRALGEGVAAPVSKARHTGWGASDPGQGELGTAAMTNTEPTFQAGEALQAALASGGDGAHATRLSRAEPAVWVSGDTHFAAVVAAPFAGRPDFLSRRAARVSGMGIARVDGGHIRWGRWNSDLTISAARGGLSTIGDIHYIGSPDVTAGLPRAGTATFTYLAGSGTGGTDELGRTYLVVPGGGVTQVMVDFGSQQVTDFRLKLDSAEAGRAWQVSLAGGPVRFTDAVSGGVGLAGTCQGSDCSGAATGSATFQFVGTNAGGGYSAFGMTATDAPEKGVVGTLGWTQ
jgi:hypothetical protein